ncbi:transcriptional regulator, SarA/Rot family [Hominenteromicrobium sp.]
MGETLNRPRPDVTRTVKEIEQKDYLQKTASEEDGRVTYISATKASAVM